MKHLFDFDPIIESQNHFALFKKSLRKLAKLLFLFSKSFKTDAPDQIEITFMDANI